MGRIIIAITTALAVVAAVNFFTKKSNLKQEIPNPIADSWEHWKQTNGKSYGNNSEEEYRSKVFKNNWYIVQKHNEKDAKFKLSLNVFADLTREEFAKTYTGFNNAQKFTSNETVRFNTNNLKSSVNWVDEGAVAPIKNQGQCGSCWAFSTACAVESANKIGKNQSSVTPLSEQQLVDCANGSWGNNGCHGGLMDLGFAYVKENPLVKESDYPYTGRDGTCRADGMEGVGTVSGFTDVAPGEPDQLRAALSQQPVSVAIEADQSIFQLYKSGVITSECGQQLDHGVTAVGYGTEDGEDYFLVRNSWGETWGDAGYVKIGASEENICGILSKASYPRA